jgi:hypothetical protein
MINLLLAAILGFVLSRMYEKFGRSLSNRRNFAKNFVLLTMTTMLIITVVKSSLALSLGLVGALSIVRFRAAIKEPEELSYLFFAIAIGLGLGADQRVITLVGFLFIAGVISARSLSRNPEQGHNLYVTVNSHNPKKAELRDIVEILQSRCLSTNLKRIEETNEELEATFLVEFGSFAQLNASKAELQKLGESVKITFLDNNGVGEF